MQTHKSTQHTGKKGASLSEGASRTMRSSAGKDDMTSGRKVLSDPAASPERQGPEKLSDDELKEMKPTQLAEYITFRFHAYMWKNMPMAHDLLISVIRAHGQEHEELSDVLKLLGKLRTDIEGHLLDEETNVFPHLSKNDEKTRKERAPEVEHLMEEHEETEELLKKIRKTAKDYEVPEDAGEEYRRLYSMLPQMEEETYEHYHVENDILFPEISTK